MAIRKVTVRLERITPVVPSLWAADPVGPKLIPKGPQRYSKNPKNSHNFEVILASSANDWLNFSPLL
jgi:hypothetical protein